MGEAKEVERSSTSFKEPGDSRRESFALIGVTFQRVQNFHDLSPQLIEASCGVRGARRFWLASRLGGRKVNQLFSMTNRTGCGTVLSLRVLQAGDKSG